MNLLFSNLRILTVSVRIKENKRKYLRFTSMEELTFMTSILCIKTAYNYSAKTLHLA